MTRHLKEGCCQKISSNKDSNKEGRKEGRKGRRNEGSLKPGGGRGGRGEGGTPMKAYKRRLCPFSGTGTGTCI